MTMARYSTMGFAQFTSMLINNVFDALISANIRQTEAYIQLVEAVGQTLQNFIANTQNAISQEEITQFLAPLANIADGENLIDADVTRVNDALALPDDAGVAGNNRVTTAGALDAAEVTDIRLAAGRRLAANKFAILQEMVRQGILRIVVDNGIIETRLTFSSFRRTSHTSSTFDQVRDASRETTTTGALAVGLGFLGAAGSGTLGLGAGAGVAKETESSLHVTSARETQRDVSGSRMQIFGRVEIQFKTDYVPLNT